jgi:dihydrofolate reductase
MTIRIIAAISQNNVIGKNGTIPWHYKEDMEHFKHMTAGSIIIMGRKTWESLPKKPLSGRENIVISSSKERLGNWTFSSLSSALEAIAYKKDFAYQMVEEAINTDYYDSYSIKEASSFVSMDINLIGGYRIYEEGMKYADEICLTLIPEYIDEDGDIVKFPLIDGTIFHSEYIVPLSQNIYGEKTILQKAVYHRK